MALKKSFLIASSIYSYDSTIHTISIADTYLFKMKFDLIFKTLLMNSANEKVKCNLNTVRHRLFQPVQSQTVKISTIFSLYQNEI